jgi:hypothetical protein
MALFTLSPNPADAKSADPANAYQKKKVSLATMLALGPVNIAIVVVLAEGENK